MANKRCAVLGSGYKGLVGAYLLSVKGYEVAVFDKAKNVGGVMNSIARDGFYLDLGCHLFDNVEREITRLTMDLLENEIVPVNVKYGSILNGKKSNMAVPDLTSLGDEISNKIVAEMLDHKKSEIKASNALNHLRIRHGQTACSYLEDSLEKVFASDPKKLSPLALDSISLFNRIRVGTEFKSRKLKEDPYFDDRLAVPPLENPLEFYRDQVDIKTFRNFYPKGNGMGAFSEKAKRKLDRMGVSFFLGSEIERLEHGSRDIFNLYFDGNKYTFDKVFWALPVEFIGDVFKIETTIKGYSYPVPMVLYYFFLEKKDLGNDFYIHNYDKKDIVFRMSIPSHYGEGNAPEGKGYICCEVPTSIDSETWENAEYLKNKVWEEVKKYGLSKAKKPLGSWMFKTPVSYRVPKLGYEEILKNTLEKVPKSNSLIGCGDWSYNKINITRDLLELL